MNSLILRTSNRVILPIAILFSLYVLLRGHNAPGGGFIGGLIAAAGLTVYALPLGRDALLARLRVSPKWLIGLGVLLAFVSGLAGLLAGRPFLTHLWTDAPGFAIGTPFVFDLGVYLAVIGAVLTFFTYYLED